MDEEFTKEQILIMLAVKPMLRNCANSYVNAYTQAWLEAAKSIGAYQGRTTGIVTEIMEEWNEWYEDHGIYDLFSEL